MSKIYKRNGMQQMYVHVTPAELSLKEIKKNLYIQNTWIG